MPNIAFIFAHRPTDVWNTPLSIVEEFKARHWNTRIFSLFNEKGEYDFIGIQAMHVAYLDGSFEPDIVLYMDWGQYDHNLLDKTYIPKAYWVAESGDDPQQFDKNYSKSHKFNLILTPAYDSYLKYKERGHDVEWWTHFTDTKIYQRKLGNPTIDVVSSRGPGGSQFLDYMTQILGSKFVNRNGFMGEDHGRFLSSGKIVLQSSRFHEFTRRIPEAMSVGRLVITDKLPEHTHIDDLFVDGEDYVTYTGPAEAISKINYYLNSPGERERIALNGYRKVLAGHTQVQRVDTILSKYKEFLNNKI